MRHGFDKDEAERLFKRINRFSATDDGITRASYGAEETAAIFFVERWANERGFVTMIDAAGNLHVWGPHGDLPGDMAFGSHLDSVPSGGRFDGVAGVVAGMLTLERMKRARITPRHTPRLIVLRGEESAWFGKAYIGSSALFGKLGASDLDLRRRDGVITLREAIAATPGTSVAMIENGAIFSPDAFHRFYELHIEQGPVLVDAGEPIAIVSSIRGNRRYLDCKVTGEQGHSGTVPQRMRKDAVLAAMEVISALEHVCTMQTESGADLTFTVGKITTDPATHSVSVIPGTVGFSLEFRSQHMGALERFDEECRSVAETVSRQCGVTVDLGTAISTSPTTLDHEIVGELQRLLPHAKTMPSGAGHDAAVFQAAGIPSGMIFVRNANGSHNPAEAMDIDDFLLGAELLYRAVGAQ